MVLLSDLNVDKIWERLHEKYGDELEIVNSVVKDVEEISASQTNPGFVKLVNTLEKGLQDLEIIGHVEEISNAYTVKLLEKKLSKTVSCKSGWTKSLNKETMNRMIAQRETERLVLNRCSNS